MAMIAAILRSGFVGEDFVVGHVVPIHVVAGWAANRRRAGAQIADESCDGNIHDIIAEAPAIRPTARNDAAAEAGLNGTGQRIAAKNAQARETGIVGIGAGAGAVSGEATGGRREI